jgi:hypothetical protein
MVDLEMKHGPALRIGDIKVASDGWEVSGYPSVYGVVDLGNDVVMRGAFDATLADDTPVRFLFAHNSQQILGRAVELKSDDKGLFGRFKISKTNLGQDVHTLLKDGALDSFSIGYIPTEVEFDDVGVRKLKAINLLEVSLVAMPMLPQARVTGVKTDPRAAESDEQATVQSVKASRPASFKDWLALDVPFEDILAQLKGFLILGTDEAEALWARRAEDERKLSDAHLAAIDAFRAEVKACDERLEHLRADQHPAEARAEGGFWSNRIALARALTDRRLRRLEAH